MKKVNLLSIDVSTGSYKEFVRHILETAEARISQYICVANVHMLVEAHNDLRFARIVSGAHIITPDGKPLAWALDMLYGLKQERVAGMDLLPDLLEQAVERQVPVYFYGGDEQLLSRTAEHMSAHYPGLIVSGYCSPPFRKLTAAEETEVVRDINASGCGLVFVILGCPKQEKWMASMKGRIQSVMVGVGGALPVMLGLQKRAPRWMQRSGLEWVFRLVQEPTRLFRRYAVTNSKFVLLLMRAYVRSRFIEKGAKNGTTLAPQKSPAQNPQQI